MIHLLEWSTRWWEWAKAKYETHIDLLNWDPSRPNVNMDAVRAALYYLQKRKAAETPLTERGRQNS